MSGCYFCGLEQQFGVPFVAVYEPPNGTSVFNDRSPVDFITFKVACPRCDPKSPIIALTEKEIWRRRMEEVERRGGKC